MSVEASDLVLEQILKDNAGRKPSLVRLKLTQMAAGVFSFYRGTNDQFAREWPSLRPLDPGPLVLLCGDLHLENFGAYLTESGDCRFGINDFDEAYVAPCSIDLVRCGASIILAAEEWALSPTTGAAMVVVFLDHYREEVAASALSGRIGEVEAGPKGIEGPIRELLAPTAMASRAEMVSQVTRPSKRRGHRVILRDEKHASISLRKLETIRGAFRHLDDATPSPRAIEVIDATTRIAGLGSLGLRRCLVLISEGVEKPELRLLDVKEAVPSALRICVDAPQPSWGPGEANRVINAERLINETPESGLGTIELGRRSYRVREMIPEANRSKLSRLRATPEKLRDAVREAGRIAAWAHVRGALALDGGRAIDLSHWATGPAFDAVMVAAVRAADRLRDDFLEFQRSLGRKAVRKRLGLLPRPGLHAIGGNADRP